MRALLSLLALYQVANGQTFDNELEWKGVSVYDSTNTSTVLRDLKGKTGWGYVGSGDTKTLEYNFSLELEQYGADNLPEQVGLFWAMPEAISTPNEKKWEAGLFLQYSKNAAQKIQGSLEATGDIKLEVGSRPNYSGTALQTITYDFDLTTTAISKTEGAGSGEIVNPHWVLLEDKSRLEAKKWTLAFHRTDLETLGLKSGKKMTTYMAILNN